MKTPRKNLDANQPHRLKFILGGLLVIGLILVVSWFAATQIRAGQLTNNVATPYSTLASQTAKGTTASQSTMAPQVPIVTTAKEPPACTFPLAQSSTMGSVPENYAFSNPKLVLPNTSTGGLYLYQWLPDNQRILVGSESATPSDTGQSIELFNPQTGDTKIVGSRPSFYPEPPVWVASLNAVVYPNTVSLSPATFDSNGMAIVPPSSDYRRQLWISRGNQANAQPVENAQVTVSNDHRSRVGSAFTVAVNSDGSQIAYFDETGTQLQVRKALQGSLGNAQSSTFDATRWDYRRPANTNLPMALQVAWRPNSTQLFLYSSIQTGGYTFLLDIQSGQICELNLFGKDDPNDSRKSWAMSAHWSPNGQYLAVIRTKGPPIIDFSDLIVLDAQTGKLYQTDATKLTPSGVNSQGNHYISDIAWAPDNIHLAAIGRVDYPTSGGNSMQVVDRLFLLNFLTGQSVQVSSAEIGPNIGNNQTQLLWSVDGSQLMAQCPKGLCLLSVQKSIQP